MAEIGKEISISFKATIVPQKELPKELHEEKMRAEEGVFGLQELEIGGDQFVVVFGRTHVQY